MSDLPTLRNEPPTPEFVLQHHRDSVQALERTQSAALTGSGRFLGLSVEELEVRLRELREESEAQACMFLVASFEACIRVSSIGRSRAGKRKVPLIKQLQDLIKNRRHWEIPLDEILRSMTPNPRPGRIGNFMQVVRYRHWLAHGRYWDQKSGLRTVAPETVWERGHLVLEMVGLR